MNGKRLATDFATILGTICRTPLKESLVKTKKVLIMMITYFALSIGLQEAQKSTS